MRSGEPLRRRVRARALRALVRTSQTLPASVGRGALGLAARAARLSGAERRTRANLELALGSETTAAERRRIAAGVRHHAARQLHEWAQLAAGPSRASWLARTVELDDSFARLEDEYRRGRGVLVVTAHIGNWELLAIALRRHGFEGAVVGRQRPRDSSARFLVDMRAAWDLESIPQDTPPRVPLRVLERGGMLGILADLDVRRLAGDFLPFFGVPALTMLAPASLARAARLPLVPVRCVRPRHAGASAPYRIVVDEPLELRRDLDRRAAARDLCTRLNGVYERWIRAAPEQWAWHQPRWRTRPGSRVVVPWPAHRAAATSVDADRTPDSSACEPATPS